MTQKSVTLDPLRDLTWEDLEAWAGSKTVSRGRSYQRGRQVQGLARTPEGGLVAWVQGQKRYATQVEWREGQLASTCSCPMKFSCKHAVAVVLEYLEHLEKKRSMPEAEQTDRRFGLLGREEDELEEDDWANENLVPSLLPEAKPSRSRGSLRSFLEKQPKEELISLLVEMAELHPTIRRSLEDRRRLKGGSVKTLVQALRSDIEKLTEEPWGRPWRARGFTPQYAAIRERLEALLKSDHADQVLDLGAELLRAGSKHVEMSLDDGESAWEIGRCLDMVFRALPLSSRSPAAQMLWALEAELADEYGLCEGLDDFWRRECPAADWGILADQIESRLLPGTQDYRRRRVVHRLVEALEKAGRRDEIIPLYEREVETGDHYLLLVERLEAAGRHNDAELWIKRGIEAHRENRQGVAEQLREAWCRRREITGDWLGVATFHAERLFDDPDLASLQALLGAAERAGIGPLVRAAAVRYLETGEVPQDGTWPLPPSGLAPRPRRPHPRSFPQVPILIALAIAEKRPDDVLGWYDTPGKRIAASWGAPVSESQIAEAVVATHPERALDIWKRLAEAEIAIAKPRSYEVAAGFLRKVKRLLEQRDRAGEWTAYATTLRHTHLRKRRFLEILDGLAKGGRRILTAEATPSEGS